jgi:hypothetical protein
MGTRFGFRAGRAALSAIAVAGFFFGGPLGCTTARTFNAEVVIEMPLGGPCAETALAQQPGVKEIVATDEAGFAFRLEQPGKEREHWPAFGLVQGVDANGSTMLMLTTHYKVGFFETETEHMTERAQAIVGAVAKACTGHEPAWGAVRPCGAGEPNMLCSKGQ